MRYLIVIFIFFFFSAQGKSQLPKLFQQDYQTEFEQFSTKNGLSSNEVLSIFQDKVGYLWFSTTNGLNRYDGYQFLVYKNIPGDSNSLSSNLVTCVEEDVYGDLWIGTHYGLNKYNRKTNQFEHFLKKEDLSGLTDNYIRALHADKHGRLWIETVNGVLSCLHLPGQSFEHFKHQPVTQPYYYYHSIYQENDSTLWVGGRNSSVTRFNINQKSFDYFKAKVNDTTKKREDDIACYFEDSNSNFYVTGLDGTYLFDKKGTFKKNLTASTFSILEDREHNIWFGTGSGIFKKEPNSPIYLHYQLNPNNPTSLGGNYVNKLFQDRSGVIWVATNSGLSKYSPIRDNFRHFFHIPGEVNTVSSNYISDATQANDGSIWLATANNGIDHYFPKSNRFLNYSHDPKIPGTISSNRTSKVMLDQKNNLWVGLWSGIGINKFDSVKHQFQRYAISPNTRRTDWYNDLLEDSNGTIHLGVWGGVALYAFDSKTNSIVPSGKDLIYEPKGRSITNIHIDNESKVWLAENQPGIDQYNPQKPGYIYYRNYIGDLKYNFSLAQKLEENRIIPTQIPSFTKIVGFCTDQDKTLWMASDSGLIFKEENNSLFQKEMSVPEPLSAIKYDSAQNCLWLACTKGLIKFDIQAKQVQQFSYPKIAGENMEAAESIALAKNSNGLYFKTQQSIWRFEEKNGFSLVHEQKELLDFILDYPSNTLWGITAQTVFSIDLDSLFYREETFPFSKKLTAITRTNTNIYLAAENELYEINNWVKEAKFNLLPFQSDYKIDLGELKIQVISAYGNGRYLFLGTNKGLFEYDTLNTFFRAIRHYEQDYSGLVFHLCNDLFEDSTGDLWIGTSNTAIGRVHKGSNLTEQYDYNPLDTNSYWGNHVNTIFEDSKNRLWIAGEGLNLYHRNNNTFSHFTIKHGLASNTIYSILEDNKGNLWLGTDVGLSVFMPETESFYNYYERDGVHSDGFTKAAIKMHNGELLFGSKNGFIVFNPDSLKQNLLIPPVVITKIKVFENEIMVDLSETPELVLAPNKNTITFEFSSLDYNLPSANRYAYKLEGIDNEWVETDSKNRSIRYTNLPPGNYKFLLKGSNNQAVWGNLSTPVSIFIKSPFYLKWWFISISAIAFIGLILLFILNREKELRKEKKTRELEHRLLRSQMNPHFIFNSLGAIQSYIFKNKPIDAGTYLSKFSELVRLILENSRQELIPLYKEVDTLKLYLELQKLRFPNKLNFQFDIDETLFSDHPIIPPMMLQPFIENSIEHGFKNAKHPGMIKIQIQKENDCILLINEDNGIGIIASEKNKIPTATTYHSLATKITRERIQNMNKGKKQKIELQIIDLSTINESLSGTRVSIRIPTQAIHFKPKTDD